MLHVRRESALPFGRTGCAPEDRLADNFARVVAWCASVPTFWLGIQPGKLSLA